MTDDLPPLIPLALNVADVVYRDPVSGRYSLLGLLNTIYVERFPSVLPPFGILAAVTGGHGHVGVSLEVAAPRTANPADDRRVWDSLVDLQFDHPLQVFDVVSRVEALEVTHEGLYHVKLHADGAFLTERRVAVILNRSSGEWDLP